MLFRSGTILIGAPGNDRGGDKAGAVHVYQVLGASVFYHNGRGVNVDTLTTTPATTGQTWSATLGVVAPHAPGAAYLAVHRTCRVGTFVLGKSAEFLLDGAPFAILGPRAHSGQGSSVPFALSIPADPALVGMSWAAQGFLTGGAPGLTNAAAGLVQ